MAKKYEAALKAVYALRDGDLAPLGKFLRRWRQLPPWLAEELADAIDGTRDPLYRVYAKKSRSGPGTQSEIAEQFDRMVAIAEFVEGRIDPSSRGQTEAAIAEACQEFGVTRSTVTLARRRWRSLRDARKFLDDLMSDNPG